MHLTKKRIIRLSSTFFDGEMLYKHTNFDKIPVLSICKNNTMLKM